MTMRVGIPVRHRIHDQNHVVAQIVGTARGRFHAGTRRNTRQEDLTHSPSSQFIIQRCGEKCAHSLFANSEIAGMLPQLRNKLSPIRRKSKLGPHRIDAAWRPPRHVD